MTRDCYQKIGTHMTSQQCIHEDLLLARTALEQGPSLYDLFADSAIQGANV